MRDTELEAESLAAKTGSGETRAATRVPASPWTALGPGRPDGRPGAGPPHRGVARGGFGTGRALTALCLGAFTACGGSRVEGADKILETAWSGIRSETREGVTPEPPSDRAGTDDLERTLPEDEPSHWTLEEVLERIRSANPTLGIARARLEEATASKEEALAAYFPELSLGLDYLSTDNPAQAFAVLLNQEKLTLGPSFDPTPGATENWREEVHLSWPLFAPGRRESLLAAGEGEEAARLASTALERRLLNAGIQAWLGLRAARELESVAWDSVAVVERRLEQTRKRHEEGAALRADVLRLETRHASARQDAARATLATRRAASSLNQLMGRSPEAVLLQEEGELRIGASLPDAVEELLAEAVAGRRDLMAAAVRVRLAGFQSAASRAERLPFLQAFATYGVDGSTLEIDTDLDSYLLGVGLRLPLSARTGPRIRRSEALEQRMLEELRELTLSVAREVHDAWEALRVAKETLALAESATGAADEAFRIVSEAQDAGGATVTDVLEAEDARKSARVRFVAARTGVEIARAQLVAATGGVR